LYVTEAEVGELLTPADAFAAVEASFARVAEGLIENAPRTRLPIPEGVFAVMPCVDRGLGYAGLKTYAWTPDGTPFLVVLMSLDEPKVEALVEAERLGQLRTAAASAVAARHLARDGARTLGVIGCGRQAASHVVALREVLPSLEETIVYCRDGKTLGAFCTEHGCTAAESNSEAAGCDVVVTATSSHDPVVRGEWLQPGVLVIGIGANEPDARELDNVVLERATFVCTDSREQARLEAGDLIEPVARGVLDWLEVNELQDVVTGAVSGRSADDDIVLFKSNGLPAWDLAAAARVVELVSRRGRNASG
jgi:ornithine cyclodeaminase/alanine dehydrogenase-like protein (mu-crystallin family)